MRVIVQATMYFNELEILPVSIIEHTKEGRTMHEFEI